MNWQNCPDNIEPYVGFIYLITNQQTGRKYIGKKLFHSVQKRKPLKGKVNKRKRVVETDWQDYWSSCNELLEDIEKYGKEIFRREMLSFHKTRWEWSYAELKEQVNKDVLRDKAYYNKYIRIRLPSYKFK